MFDYTLIGDAIAEGDAEETIALTKRALGQGYPAEIVLEKGLIAGMSRVADKFRHQKVLVPEVLLSTRAMHAGLTVVDPFLIRKSKKRAGKVVLGTVAGDLHDIGKNLVKIMLTAVGIKVVDLGVDVTAKEFANAVRREKPDLLMMSSLLTTTMPAMREVIDELEARGLRDRIRVIVGGAPVTETFAREIGADYYFEDSFTVKRFLEENMCKIMYHEKEPVEDI